MSSTDTTTDSDGEQENRSPAVINTQIALDMLEYLQDNHDVCAWLSIHAGNHPYVRWSEDEDVFLYVRSGGYGEIEVQKVAGEALTDDFAENPIDLIPATEATDSNGNQLWKRVANREDDEKVTFVGNE